MDIDKSQNILVQLEQQSAEIATAGPTGAKFPLIKTALQSVCRKLPPDTRLPSIRKIATALNTTVVPVQRAVTELKNENFLYSKNKSGIFTMDTHSSNIQNETESNESGMNNFKRKISFLTDSTAPRHRRMWAEIRRLFEQQTGYIELNFDFRALENKNIAAPFPDILETSDWAFHRCFSNLKLLNIKDFLPVMTQASPAEIIGDTLIPVYYQSIFLIFNTKRLSQHKLPEPAYQNFEEQLEYIQEAQKAGLNISIVQPVILLGQYINKIISSVRSGQSIDDTDIPEKFELLTRFLKSFRYRKTFKDPELNVKFKQGKAETMLTNSNEIADYKTESLPFEWKSHPAFALDNQLLKLPIAAGVVKTSPSPVECIRFIDTLRSEPVQDIFTANGYLPIFDTDAKQFNCRAVGVKLLNEKLSDSQPVFINTPENHYLSIYIINAELWNCIYGLQDCAQTLKKIITYSKAYLKNRNSLAHD
jgi:hypothetical protein